MDYLVARKNMVEQQVRPWDVLDPAVLALMHQLPREEFVPEAYKTLAYTDAQIPLGHGQVMLPPREVGRIVQSLQLQPTDHVLEIGTGSGYLTTLLALQAEKVTTVELFPDISAVAKENCLRHDLSNVTFAIGDAAISWDKQTTFDIICITGALPAITEQWLSQLKIGGRLFAVVGQAPVMQATLVTRRSEKEWEQRVLYETLIPTLLHTENKTPFEF